MEGKMGTKTQRNYLFILYCVGVLLLASGCLWGAGLIPSSIPMYIGVGVIATACLLASVKQVDG